MLVYDESAPRAKYDSPFNILRFDANAFWLSHKENELMLKFFLMNGTRDEKQQASKELQICERKLAFWANAPQFDPRRAANEAGKLNKNWTR